MRVIFVQLFKIVMFAVMKTNLTIFSVLALMSAVSCGPAQYQPQSVQDEEYNIGYTKTTRKDATGAVSKLDMKNQTMIYTNIYEYLQGQVAGVEVIGDRITIRGINTINGDNTPLFIVDGAQVNDISDISPSIIDSVEVLKDGSYTAAYGSRGGAGVIIINLKK